MQREEESVEEGCEEGVFAKERHGSGSTCCCPGWEEVLAPGYSWINKEEQTTMLLHFVHMNVKLHSRLHESINKQFWATHLFICMG